MLHLLGFQKICILDLVAILFHFAKVPSIGFDFLLDSCLAYYATSPSIKILFANMLIKVPHFPLSTRLKSKSQKTAQIAKNSSDTTGSIKTIEI